MKLFLNVYDGIDRRVLDAPCAGHRLIDHVAVALRSVAPVDMFTLDGASGWPSTLAGHDASLSGDAGVLVVDADVWLSRAAVHGLLAVADRAGSAVLATLPATPGGGEGGEPRGAVLYLPASVAARAVRQLDASALRRGLGHLDGHLVNAIGTDLRALDPAAPAERVRNLLDLSTLERRILLARAAAALLGGVHIRDPQTVAIRGELTCGAGVEIDLGVIIEGRVTLADGVKIGPHVILRNATIGANTHVHAYSIVDDANVGDNVFVGPYGRVRPGSVIGDRVQIGNFVEIKNSVVGAGSRINHLAFVGDATLGSAVTLGAGTITCNHNRLGVVRTEIGDGAYVGSGTELVAPVVIGAGATIAAGSTITGDAPAGKLTVARARQVTLPDWSPPDAASGAS